MALKRLKSYKECVMQPGRQDPLYYMLLRFEKERRAGNDRKAEELATFLIPYGHGKALPKDAETGEVAQAAVFILD